MAAWDYDESLDELLKSEGGYVNHPSDPGGPTNFGITLGTFRRYVKASATAEDVRNMSVEQAKQIYRAMYWDANWCDSLPAGVDYAVFDFAVNSANRRAVKYLQRIVGAVDDGVMGPDTIKAVNEYVAKYGGNELVDKLCEARLVFLKGLKTWSVFGRGWETRDKKVDRIGNDMDDHPEKYGYEAQAPAAGSPSAPGDPVTPTPAPVQEKKNFWLILLEGLLKLFLNQ